MCFSLINKNYKRFGITIIMISGFKCYKVGYIIRMPEDLIKKIIMVIAGGEVQFKISWILWRDNYRWMTR